MEMELGWCVKEYWITEDLPEGNKSDRRSWVSSHQDHQMGIEAQGISVTRDALPE